MDKHKTRQFVRLLNEALCNPDFMISKSWAYFSATIRRWPSNVNCFGRFSKTARIDSSASRF